MSPKVSLAFVRLSDAHLVIFVQLVIDHITGNASFPTPPVTMVLLGTTNDSFRDAIMAAQMGGPMQTAAKNALRATVEDMMRRTALYVTTCANGDLEKLLSSGFEPTSTNRVSQPLPQPASPTVRNGNTTELIVSVTSVPNARSYETRVKPEEGDWQQSVFTTGSRRITVSGLTPGQPYTVEVRAIGGATGLSPWSDPTTRMSL